jgi:hypothetical protein
MKVTRETGHRFSAIRLRSINDPHQGSLPTEQTVKPLSPPRDTCIRCKPSHPSPSARQFRLLLKELPPAELRRMFLQLTPDSSRKRRRIFCSDEGDARDGTLDRKRPRMFASGLANGAIGPGHHSAASNTSSICSITILLKISFA